MKTFFKVLAMLLVFALVSGVAAGYTFWYMSDGSGQKSSGDTSDIIDASYNISDGSASIGDVIKATTGPVVGIVNKYEIEGFQNYEGEGAGSGVIFEIDDDYIYILTNHHVISGAVNLSVDFGSDVSKEAEIVGSDEDTDIAVLTVKKTDFTDEEYSVVEVARIGDSDTLEVGDTAIAIGNSLGYGESVTKGIISAVSRDFSTLSKFAYSYIQTDAAINPGNSGGALINAAGEVIGINSSKIASTDVEGVGFAIPINAAMEIARTIQEKGYLPKAFLGVSTVELTERQREYYDFPVGVYVMSVVEGSPADLAGIIKGDVIVSVGDTAVSDNLELSYAIRLHEPGDEVIVKVYSDDEMKEYTVVLTMTEK